MKEGLKNRIANYLHDWKQYDRNKWVHAGEIEDLAKGAGYMGSTATRLLRKLVEDNVLEERPAGKSKEYRYNW